MVDISVAVTVLCDVLDKEVGMNLLRLLFRQMMPFSDNHRAITMTL